MKKLIALIAIAIVSSVAYGQLDRHVVPPTGQDLNYCSSDGVNCMVVNGTTGAVNVPDEITLEEGIILRGTNQNINGNERTGVFRMASINDLAAATTSAVMDVKAGFAVSSGLLLMSCHRDVDANSYTTKMLMWRSRNGTEADPAAITTSTYGAGAAFTAKANPGGLSIQNDAGVFLDCTALFIGPAGY